MNIQDEIIIEENQFSNFADHADQVANPEVAQGVRMHKDATSDIIDRLNTNK